MSRLINEESCKLLQKDPSSIRNICILAHVDHGKTSLSDSLLASNGIISTNLAGKVRFLDSREDEQTRGITMESSAISLFFRVLKKKDDGEVQASNNFINLIDSPGHIDFSSEVSAASRLCDGAVVLVDVVEGVCSQTVTVLRQCWTENLKPILVLNKIDRLVTELKFSAEEAYEHLQRVIENVNSVIGSFFQSDRALQENIDDINNDSTYDDDSDLYFSPEKNNVIFASAVDGWGFNIGQISKFYETKLGMNRDTLNKVLWGEYYFDAKNKKILTKKTLKGRNIKPMFVSFILDNIWRIYNTCLVDQGEEPDLEKLKKMCSVLNVELTPRDLRTKDLKSLLRTVMKQWLPVSTAALLTIVEKIPSPLNAQKSRLDNLLANTPESELLDQRIKSAMECCDSTGPVSAYVSKMLSIPRSELPQTAGLEETINAAKSLEIDKAASKDKKEEQDEAQQKVNDESIEEKLQQLNISTKNFDLQESNESKDDLIENDVTNEEIHDPLNDEDNNAIIKTDKGDEIKIITEMAPAFDINSLLSSNKTTINTNESNVDSTEGYDDVEDDEEFNMMDYVPPEIDASDPLAALFEYDDEDPFGDYGFEEEDDDINDNEALIAFGRIYSGTLKVGQLVTILEPKYSPLSPNENIHHNVKITDLYLFMGRDLLPLEEVPCGNIVGIGGLAGRLLKNGTIIENNLQGVNLAGSVMYSQPIVRVAVEPVNPMKFGKLVKGLRMLNQCDPCVETFVNENGEHILCTAGELHLERCLKDLTERFSKIEITSSDPVIPYKESFYSNDEMNPIKSPLGERGVFEFAYGKYKFKISTRQMSEKCANFLIEHEDLVKKLALHRVYHKQFYNRLQMLLPDGFSIENIAAFGGKKYGPNILFSKNNLLRVLHKKTSKDAIPYGDSIINGFQLATNEGPLAKEEVQRMIVVIESFEEIEVKNGGQVVDISGRLMTGTKNAIYQSFLDWSPRLLWAMYSCTIQTSLEVLGKVYAVVQQRHGRIVSEEMKEGTPFFEIVCNIPVVEAFGFSESIRKRSSGAALPQLVFSGYEPIDLDPFWVPTTEEELEELGEFAERENIARKHMNDIRRRKGLFVDDKVVKDGQKQKTLKKD
ncbi:related to Ribosome assembly protein 1 [Hanseniaspora guilliermondii]|uniref:Ribosome assembly protein 1 n=1 Tax=Hanseniaspora guilliermondii TaxID=56406 RepID=A0A1L0B2R4_9ASCO|nr:related to Ribosome assembly protein 1 [Hanseniaspora guilliermondii]